MLETPASLIEFRPLYIVFKSASILEFKRFAPPFIVLGTMEGDRITSPPVSIIGGLIIVSGL